jgi:hypothetical protein
MSAAELRGALRCDRPRCACKRGRTVHCPAHQDRSPSLTVDQAGDTLLVRCHAGCDQITVIAALKSRQLWPSSGARRVRALESPLVQARVEILQEARRQLRRLEPYREAFEQADSIRIGHRLVREARRVATLLGERDDVWELLARAAWLETATLAAEASA